MDIEPNARSNRRKRPIESLSPGPETRCQRKSLSLAEKSVIYAERQAGTKICDIVKKTGRPRSTIDTFLKKADLTGKATSSELRLKPY